MTGLPLGDNDTGELVFSIIDACEDTTADTLSAIHGYAFSAVGQEGWGAGAIADIVRGSGGFAVLAHKDAALAGFALVRSVADEAELITIAAAPAVQRKGVARGLLACTIDHLKHQAVQQFFLEVRADNMAAIALYKRAGFAQVGVRENYYKVAGAKRVDALLFSKCLN